MDLRQRALLALAVCAFVYLPCNAQTFSVLHAFTGKPDGQYPQGTLLFSNGNLYGTTSDGGTADEGTVFEIDSSGNERILHSFTGNDGTYPSSSLIQDSAGNLYGTASSDVINFTGLVFKIDPATGQETVLYKFAGPPDGEKPGSGVVADSSGNLYGTTFAGGTGNCKIGCGTVYKLDTSGVETVLHSFSNSSDGAFPSAGLVIDGTGNLFGVTYGGAEGSAAFRIDAGGTFNVLALFFGNPSGDLVLGGNSLLYRTTRYGGSMDSGTVYAVSQKGTATVLYSFGPGSNGYNPYSGLLRDKAGNLYGTTYYGEGNCAGTLFKLDAKTHALTIVHCFNSALDGGNPYGGLVQDSAGNIYGTAYLGGPTGRGTVFKLTP